MGSGDRFSQQSTSASTRYLLLAGLTPHDFYDLYRKGEYEKAIEVIRQHPAQGICETIHKLVSAYGQMGQADKAMSTLNGALP